MFGYSFYASIFKIIKINGLDGLWSGLFFINLTVGRWLASRADTLETTGQYKSQYDFLKQKLANNVLQLPVE